MKFFKKIFFPLLMCGIFLPVAFLLAQEKSITAQNGKAIITYYSDLHKENAQWAKEAIEYVWPLYKNNFNKEPEKIKLYIGSIFVKPNNNAQWVYGLEEYKKNKCYIFISDLDKKTTQSTIAHEMFHCWQSIIGLKPYNNNSWFWEATAVWSESWVYPKNNTEHRYLADFFPFLNNYFFDSLRTREYGSYLFFYYLFQKNNFSPQKIINIVKELKEKNQKELFSSRPTFYQELKEYAFWNWNKKIAKKYRDDPSFPSVAPSGSSLILEDIEKDKPKSESVFVSGGGMVYFVINIANDIDKIVFDLKQANKLRDNHLALQALININGNWSYEDWSEIKKRKFCRHRPSEKVQKIVLIISNSKLTPSEEEAVLSSHLEINPKGECPRVWHGKTTITSDISNPLMKENSQLVFEEELQPITEKGGRKCFAIKKQKVSFESSEITRMKCPFIDCDGSISKTTKESGSTLRFPQANTDEFLCRFYENDEGKLIFNHSTEIYGKCDYVTRTESTNSNCSCPIGSFGDGDNKTERGLCHSIYGLDVLDEIPTEIKNNKISGEEIGESAFGGSHKVKLKWEYIKE